VTGNGPTDGVGPASGPMPTSDNSAQALRLRTEHPRITRLSRKVLAGGTALALLLISGAVLWALRGKNPHELARDELYSTDHHNVADGLTTLPQDYAAIPRDVPRLGSPLPGDLGRPIVTRRRPISPDWPRRRTTACQSGNRGGAHEQNICVDHCASCATACRIPGIGDQNCAIF